MQQQKILIKIVLAADHRQKKKKKKRQHCKHQARLKPIVVLCHQQLIETVLIQK